MIMKWEEAKARIKELEEAYSVMKGEATWNLKEREKVEARIEELEEGIEKVLKWRGLDGDGISDPLRKELYGLVGRKE